MLGYEASLERESGDVRLGAVVVPFPEAVGIMTGTGVAVDHVLGLLDGHAVQAAVVAHEREILVAGHVWFRWVIGPMEDCGHDVRRVNLPTVEGRELLLPPPCYPLGSEIPVATQPVAVVHCVASRLALHAVLAGEGREAAPETGEA